MIIGIVLQSIAVATASFSAYWWGINRYGTDNIFEARTVAFATLILSELLIVFSTRSSRYTALEVGLPDKYGTNRDKQNISKLFKPDPIHLATSTIYILKYVA